MAKELPDGSLPGIKRHEEAALDAKIERSFQSYREPPNGRNVFAWKMRYLDNKTYKGKFDKTFRGCPDSPEWWEDQFCPICDRRKSMCLCAKGVEIKEEEPRMTYHIGVVRG